MTLTPATAALDAANIAYRVLPYEHDPAVASFGLEAAEALGLDPSAVFKTLLASLDSAAFEYAVLVVALVPVAGKLDLKALARAAGAKKATMAQADDAERTTGYVVGGISPFGQRKRVPTYVDETVLLWDEVYVSGGRRGLDLAVAPADLLALLDAIVVPLATG